MSKIVQLKKEGINEYPITIPEAVIDNNGITVKDKIKSLENLIENIQPGGSSVFVAEHGVTTYDEVVEAKNAGKFVICIKDRLTYHLSYVSEDLAYFTTIRGNVSYATYINKATNKWTDALYSLEQLSNKVTSLSSASTDTQYPSAKAVYDAIQQSGGGKSKFQLYQYNGGRFFSNENVYNIFDALRNESPEYYTDLTIDEVLETDRYYSFSELGIGYGDLLGVIYGGKAVEIHLGQDDYSSLHTPGEGTDTSMYFDNEAFYMYINIVEQTLILNVQQQ